MISYAPKTCKQSPDFKISPQLQIFTITPEWLGNTISSRFKIIKHSDGIYKKIILVPIRRSDYTTGKRNIPLGNSLFPFIHSPFIQPPVTAILQRCIRGIYCHCRYKFCSHRICCLQCSHIYSIFLQITVTSQRIRMNYSTCTSTDKETLAIK